MSWLEIQFYANTPLKYAYLNLNLLVANAKQLTMQLPVRLLNMSAESLSYARDLDEACMDGNVSHIFNVPHYTQTSIRRTTE